MEYSDRSIRVTSLDWLTMVLVIVGAINWGLVGLGGFVGVNLNLVELILGFSPALVNLVFLLVGLAGVYELYFAYQLRSAERTAARPAAE